MTFPHLPGECVTRWDWTDVVGFVAGGARFLLEIGGVVAFLIILWGALQYATAFGDDTKTGKAKQTIQSALIGIVIIAGAIMLVSLAWTLFSNQSLDLFEIITGSQFTVRC